MPYLDYSRELAVQLWGAHRRCLPPSKCVSAGRGWVSVPGSGIPQEQASRASLTPCLLWLAAVGPAGPSSHMPGPEQERLALLSIPPCLCPVHQRAVCTWIEGSCSGGRNRTQGDSLNCGQSGEQGFSPGPRAGPCTAVPSQHYYPASGLPSLQLPSGAARASSTTVLFLSLWCDRWNPGLCMCWARAASLSCRCSLAHCDLLTRFLLCVCVAWHRGRCLAWWSRPAKVCGGNSTWRSPSSDPDAMQVEVTPRTWRPWRYNAWSLWV